MDPFNESPAPELQYTEFSTQYLVTKRSCEDCFGYQMLFLKDFWISNAFVEVLKIVLDIKYFSKRIVGY